MADYAVVVIGSGPVGLSVAFELATRGVQVAVLEASTVGSGAARRNAGWVVPIMAAPVPSPGVVGQAARWMFKATSPLRVRHPARRPVAFIVPKSLLKTPLSVFDQVVNVHAGARGHVARPAR